MVGTRRFGRLGNELYQSAAVIGYAKKHNLEWSLPNETNNEHWNPIHFQHLKHPNWVNGREDILINEERHSYYELPFEESWRDKQIVLNGYFQSYKHFDFCRDEVLRAFNFSYAYDDMCCSIHVRRGDYLFYPTKHPVVTMDYVNRAMTEIFVKTGLYNFNVFSDDIEWCKQNLQTHHKWANFWYSENNDEITDLKHMSWCAHNICSNSTMSVWAAELNQNPDKIVIIPSEDNWFGVDNKHLDIHDLYRKEWIQIKY